MSGGWRIRVLALVLASFGLWSGWQFWPEYRAARLGRLDQLSLSSAILQGQADLPSPSSYRGQSTLMEACLRVLGGLFIDIQPEDARRAVAGGCAQSAREILERSPTSALPYAVIAQAAFQDGDPDAGRAAIMRSQATSPTTGWLAQQRVELALDHIEALDEATQRAIAMDIVLLASVPSGSRVLAARFRGSEAVRELITSALEDAPSGDQRRFIENLRAQGT